MLKAGSLVFTPPKQPADLRNWTAGCQVFAIWRPPGASSLPHANSAPSIPPRAANSHSASAAFPPNGYGVYDMIGNVWEWTADWFSPKHKADVAKAFPENPRGGCEEGSYDHCQPGLRIPRKVIKGGSHLCAPNYCRRYRPAARHAEPVVRRQVTSDFAASSGWDRSIK